MKKEITLTKTQSNDIIVFEGVNLPLVYSDITSALNGEILNNLERNLAKMFNQKNDKIKDKYTTIRQLNLKINIEIDY